MMDKVKVAVFVSGGGTNLQALIDASERGELPHAQLALVVSNNPEAYALERAKRHGIEIAVVSSAACPDQQSFEAELTRLLGERGIQMIVLAGFMKILSEQFTAAWPRRILNVHPSLIPAFCGKGFYGLRVHQAALDYGVKVTGATVHFVNEIPDGGEIILQKAVEIQENDTPETLQRRVMEQAEWKLLPAAVEKVAARMAGKDAE